MKNSKKLSRAQEKSKKLWQARFAHARELGLEKGRTPVKFSAALKARLYRANKTLPRAMQKGGKEYININGNYYKYTSLKVTPKEAYALRQKGEKVFRDRLIVNSSIDYRPTLHRKFKDEMTGKKGLAIVYRETGRGPMRKRGSNYRVKLIGQGFSAEEFIKAIENGQLPDDKTINYSVSIGSASPFKRIFKGALELAYYMRFGAITEEEKFEPPPGKDRHFLDSTDAAIREAKRKRLMPTIHISVYRDTRMRPISEAKKRSVRR